MYIYTNKPKRTQKNVFKNLLKLMYMLDVFENIRSFE